MPSRTSRTSAPTASHTLATALAKVTLAARKAFDAYLIVSADAGSVTITGARRALNRPATRAAATWSWEPMTMRSGFMLSCTAEPSRRNSGLETTLTSSRPSTSSTTRAEPTGTVDLLTTMHSGASNGPISAAAARMYDRSADPSSDWGVGTHR